MTGKEFTNRTYTIKELKDFLNQFQDDDTIEFYLWADATWTGAIGEFLMDVNKKTVFSVDF